MKFSIKRSVLCLVALFALSACINEKPTNNSASDISSNVYKVYGEQNYVPFIMHNQGGSKSEKVSGFEYDILQAIAEKQGLNFEYVAYVWDDLFPALQRQAADIVSSGITITEERKKDMLFSNPFLETETVLLAKNKEFKSFNDMIGKRVSYQNGTLQQEIIDNIQNGKGVANGVKTAWGSVNDVMQGRADMAMGDKVVMDYYITKYPNEGLFIISNPKAEKELLGFAVSKQQPELVQQLNSGLSKIKADGTYDIIYRKWFGSGANSASDVK